jgi:hypothetical protein
MDQPLQNQTPGDRFQKTSPPVNYIRHLNAFFSLVKNDPRLSTTHVSLYLALFHYWNFHHFQNPISIYRENLMQISKIGSKNTYHRCIKQLHEAEYIYYHPSSSRFGLVRISIVRLYNDEETDSTYKQLDLFSKNSRAPETGVNGPCTGTEIDTDTVAKSVPVSTKNGTETTSESKTSCPKNGTDTVSKMVRTSTKSGTDTVSKVGHSINKTFYKLNSVCNTPTEIFEKNRELSDKVNQLAGVPKSIPGDPPLEAGNSSFPKGGARRAEDFQGGGPPTITDAESFFHHHNSTTDEAQKFFYYNQGKNWMLTDKLPISNWKALARKWLLSSKHQNKPPMDPKTAVQSIYEQYLKGEKINKLLLPEFADILQLQITETIKREAIQRRINQLSGSNENSHVQLWKAYMEDDFSNDIVAKDEPNLLALAKRLAVAKHFQKLKSKHQENLFPSTG